MKYKATKVGFMGSRIRPGEIFEAAEGIKISWAEPVEEPVKEPEKKTASRKKKKSKKSD